MWNLGGLEKIQEINDFLLANGELNINKGVNDELAKNADHLLMNFKEFNWEITKDGRLIICAKSVDLESRLFEVGIIMITKDTPHVVFVNMTGLFRRNEDNFDIYTEETTITCYSLDKINVKEVLFLGYDEDETGVYKGDEDIREIDNIYNDSGEVGKRVLKPLKAKDDIRDNQDGKIILNSSQYVLKFFSQEINSN